MALLLVLALICEGAYSVIGDTPQTWLATVTFGLFNTARVASLAYTFFAVVIWRRHCRKGLTRIPMGVYVPTLTNVADWGSPGREDEKM